MLILITVSSLTLITVPQTASQTENVKVMNYNYYLDAMGYLDVVGEVQNTGSTIISNVTLGGTITISGGEQTQSVTMVWVKNLLPQQKAPFYMEFPPNGISLGSWINVEILTVDLTVYQAEPTTGHLYPDIAVTSSQGTVSQDGSFWVNGNLQNTGSQSAKDVRVVATFYNSQGGIAGVGYTDTLTPNPLTPSQTTTFKVGAFDQNQTGLPANHKITTYSLLVQVTAPIIQGDAPQNSPTVTPGPITTQAPDSGTQSNNLGIASTVIYIGLIVVAIAVVVAVILLLKKRLPKTAVKTTQSGTAQTVKHKKK